MVMNKGVSCRRGGGGSKEEILLTAGDFLLTEQSLLRVLTLSCHGIGVLQCPLLWLQRSGVMKYHEMRSGCVPVLCGWKREWRVFVDSCLAKIFQFIEVGHVTLTIEHYQ